MTVGVLGLGLIGGSIAKAVKTHTDAQVLGYDISPTVIHKARLVEAIDAPLTDDTLPNCDVVIIAIYPNDTVKILTDQMPNMKKGALVVDCCGVKRVVCQPLKDAAKKAGVVFVGGHPMAGRDFSGFEYSKQDLFATASMILTPYGDTGIERVDEAKKFFLSLGFGRVVITTPEDHDRMIAYTSQLAHVVSNAYVKSPTAQEHYGFSAGSYQDLTRVARLNETMWSELFLENADFLAEELTTLIGNLIRYRQAIQDGDRQRLTDLLREGRELKEQADPAPILKD